MCIAQDLASWMTSRKGAGFTVVALCGISDHDGVIDLHLEALPQRNKGGTNTVPDGGCGKRTGTFVQTCQPVLSWCCRMILLVRDASNKLECHCNGYFQSPGCTLDITLLVLSRPLIIHEEQSVMLWVDDVETFHAVGTDKELNYFGDFTARDILSSAFMFHMRFVVRPLCNDPSISTGPWMLQH